MRSNSKTACIFAGQEYSLSSFRHQPLLDEQHIRIMTLHPAADSAEPIRCSLATTSLSSPCRYEALSYGCGMDETGDSSLSCSVLIDNTAHAIYRNLFEGLRRIRDKREPRTLWCDIVCIDQHDSSEKSSQVAQLGQIYRSAVRVILWFGEGRSEGEDLAAQSMFDRFLEMRPDRYGKFPYVDRGRAQRAFLHGRRSGWCQGEDLYNHSHCNVFEWTAEKPDHREFSALGQPDHLSTRVLPDFKAGFAEREGKP